MPSKLFLSLLGLSGLLMVSCTAAPGGGAPAPLFFIESSWGGRGEALNEFNDPYGSDIDSRNR